MSNQSNSQYFNLTADGVGFVNRIRKVQSKKGDPYFGCTIQASYGDSGDKCRFDVRVVGNEAKEAFQSLVETYPDLLSAEVKKHPTVMISFRLGDLNPKAIEFTDGDGQSRSFATIDARLLIAKSIKVNGEVFHKTQYEGRFSNDKQQSESPETQSVSDEVQTGRPTQFEQQYGTHRQ